MEASASRLERARPAVQFAGTMPSPPAYCTGAFKAATNSTNVLAFTT